MRAAVVIFLFTGKCSVQANNYNITQTNCYLCTAIYISVKHLNTIIIKPYIGCYSTVWIKKDFQLHEIGLQWWFKGKLIPEEVQNG